MDKPIQSYYNALKTIYLVNDRGTHRYSTCNITIVLHDLLLQTKSLKTYSAECNFVVQINRKTTRN